MYQILWCPLSDEFVCQQKINLFDCFSLVCCDYFSHSLDLNDLSMFYDRYRYYYRQSDTEENNIGLTVFINQLNIYIASASSYSHIV